MIVGGVLLMLMLTGSYKVKPSIISKVNTVAQIALAAVVLASLGRVFDDFDTGTVLTYVVAATTLISGAGYLGSWVRHTETMEDSR